MAKTKLIVIEGSDGSGKQTQAGLIYDSLSKFYKVKKISYPSYDLDSSIFVKKYLDFKYGTLDEVSPNVASSFFMMDRIDSYYNKDYGWKDDYLSGEYDFIILDRYVTSNLLHQGGRYSTKVELTSYVRNQQKLEYLYMGLPEPDLTVFLDMPVWAANQLRAGRTNKATGEEKQDIHESNGVYLARIYSNSKYIADLCEWDIIPCIDKNDEIYPKEIIRDMILIAIHMKFNCMTENMPADNSLSVDISHEITDTSL